MSNSEKKLKQDDTRLQIFTFGDAPDDRFYCLVNLKASPSGLDVDKLKLSDPRNFDQMLSQSGCLLLLTQEEVEELLRRGELQEDNLHKGLYQLCVKEGII